MADTRTYPCTPAQLDSLTAMLAQHDVAVDLSKPGGQKQSSWDIAWAFPAPNFIAITVKAHPFAEEGFLWSKLDGIFST